MPMQSSMSLQILHHSLKARLISTTTYIAISEKSDLSKFLFYGAPGTGKSYLAKEIAADIISNGYYDSLADLSDEQKTQVEFVQFHPSYDYSDFVEGLRPKVNDDGSMIQKIIIITR